MEFEDVEDELAQEMRRVSSALGVTQWMHEQREAVWMLEGHNASSVPVHCSIDKTTLCCSLVAFGLGEDEASFTIDYAQGHAQLKLGSSTCNELVVNGLFRLGFEGEELWKEYGVHLSAHEKMELRLSMPREFWPKTWLEEEEG